MDREQLESKPYPIYATQGGGLVRPCMGGYIFIEVPPNQPSLDIGSQMPIEWDLIPANHAARLEEGL